MVNPGHLMPGKGGEGNRGIRVMRIGNQQNRSKDKTEEEQFYNLSAGTQPCLLSSLPFFQLALKAGLCSSHGKYKVVLIAFLGS